MLSDSEVQGICRQVRQVLIMETRLTLEQIQVVITDIHMGEFTSAFSSILAATPCWAFGARRRTAKAVRRLLVPEYMQDLLALRRLCGLLEEGFCLRRNYVKWEDSSDIISTMNWLMDHGKINYSLWRRFLNCIGSRASVNYTHAPA